MSKQMLGTRIPRVVPMTDEQYRTHKRLGAAEKRLVHLIVWNEDPAKIAKAQQNVNRWTTAWKRSCQRAELSHRETGATS